MNKIKSRLSVKLSLSILALAIPIFILAIGILFLQSRNFFRQEAARRADNTLNTMMQQVRNYMMTIETATNSNAWLVEEHFQPDTLLAVSRRIVQLNRRVSGCSITAEPDMFPQYGRYFSAYSIRKGDTILTERENAYNYYEKEWYKAPRQQGKACWIDPYDDFNEGTLSAVEPIASYCRPLYQKKKLVGVIASDLSIRQLADTINKVTPPYPGAYYALIGSKGRYLVHPDTARVFKSTVFRDYSPETHADIIALGHEMVAGKKGCTHVDVNGCIYQVSYRPVEGTNWSLAVVCPDKEVLKSYYQLTYLVTLLIIVGMLVILWLCRRVVNHAISPIAYLVNKSQRIIEGHYDEQIPVSQRTDAIGLLQNSFAAMQQSLNKREQSIQQATKEWQLRNEELVEAKQKAEEAVRQKNLFIQDVSHQIRTPLNIIMGFANVISETSIKPEEMSEISKMMKYNAMHLNRMVLMLFDSSDSGIHEELKTEKADHVSCNELAKECIDYTYVRFPELTVHFDSGLADDFVITTNRHYLMRTICELLYNAAKYSDGKHILLHITTTPTTVRFIVEDVGKGLAEEQQELIFKPFSKIDNLSEGLGLGLPLAKRHALNLGGDLTIDADYHVGCRFIAEMPR